MLKAIGFIVKLIIFSVIVLVAGNWVSWDGRTLNHHLQTTLHNAERSDAISQAKDWTRKITDDAREGFGQRTKHRSHSSAEKRAVTGKNNSVQQASREEDESSDVTETAAAAPAPVPAHTHAEFQASSGEKIPSSERQKLRALIRELNSSQDKR